MLLLSVGILGRSASLARLAAGTLSAPVDDAVHGASVLADNGRDKNISKEQRADADLALRVAMKAGELAGVVIAIHANANTASLDVLDEARALRARIRQDMREGNHREKAVEPLSPAAADAGLRTAMEGRKLEDIVDAIHSNSKAASPEVLKAAKDVRDELRDAKHAAAGGEKTGAAKDPTRRSTAAAGQAPETPVVPASSAIDADAALRAAMSARTLDGLMDAIHDNSVAASPEVLADAKDLRDELRDAKHAVAGGEKKGAAKDPMRRGKPLSSSTLSKFANVERLSDIFFNAIPSEDLSKVGLTIHCWDATEQITAPQEPWRPCGTGQCTQFLNWWSASTINWANHYTFGDAGIIMEPERNSVLCSYPFDSGTMSGGCISGRPENLSRVISQSMFWQHMGYNEILMNSSDFMAQLPGSIAAFVYNLKGEGKQGITYYRYQQYLKHFNLTDADVPLLRANFNGLGAKANASMGTGFNGSWRTQKKQYSNPYQCGGGADLHTTFQSWNNGDCPPTLLSMEDRKNCEKEGSEGCSAAEIPLFTDMTAHAREYLRVHSEPPEEEAPAWHSGKHFRVGANKAVPLEYERLRVMDEEEFKRDLRRNLKAIPASEAYARV